MYALTDAGREALAARADDARRSRDNLDFFLEQLCRLKRQGGSHAG
jgi:DNA-binding PadR family transcriptional regulator